MLGLAVPTRMAIVTSADFQRSCSDDLCTTQIPEALTKILPSTAKRSIVSSMGADQPETTSTYTVVDGQGKLLMTATYEEFFDTMDLLKKQDAGAKLFRVEDKVLLAYTTGYKMPKDAKAFY